MVDDNVQDDDDGQDHDDGEDDDDDDDAWHIVAASSLRPKQTSKVPPGANLSLTSMSYGSTPAQIFWSFFFKYQSLKGVHFD